MEERTGLDLSTSLLISHLRKSDKTPFATIVVDKYGKMGISVCRKTDRFRKKAGVEIAIGRLLRGSEPKVMGRRMLKLILKEIEKVEERACKYYRLKTYSVDKELLPLPISCGKNEELVA